MLSEVYLFQKYLSKFGSYKKRPETWISLCRECNFSTSSNSPVAFLTSHQLNKRWAVGKSSPTHGCFPKPLRRDSRLVRKAQRQGFRKKTRNSLNLDLGLPAWHATAFVIHCRLHQWNILSLLKDTDRYVTICRPSLTDKFGFKIQVNSITYI